MSRSIKITVELTDDLCSWIESMIFSEEVPAPEPEEEAGCEEEVEKVEVEVEEDEEKPTQDTSRFADPEYPMGRTVRDTFIKMYHLSKDKIEDRCSRFLGFEPVGSTKPTLIDSVLIHMYGNAVADPYLSHRFERYSDLQILAAQIVQSSSRPMLINEVRDELLKHHMFSPQNLYDAMSRLVKAGTLDKVVDGYVYIPKPLTAYSEVSALTHEAINQLGEESTVKDVAQLIAVDLSMKFTPKNCAKLKAAVMHALTSGIYEPKSDCDSGFRVGADINEEELLGLCTEWLKELNT